MLGVACGLVHSGARLPHRQPVLDAVVLVQIRVANQDRSIQRRGGSIDGLANRRECKRIAVNGSLAPQCDVDWAIGDLRGTREIEGRAHVVIGYLPLTAVRLGPRQRDIALDDADAQHAILRLIRQRNCEGCDVCGGDDECQCRTRKPMLA